jgi:spore coat polysaccharide biosynthesis predicted glycosyltransferase SpsG
MKITGRAVTLHSDVRAIAELMSTVDFAIGAGGTTSWERCCLGLPSLLFEVAENQREIINALVDEGAAFNGGRVDAFTEASFDAVFKDILESWAAVNLMSKRAAELCDGKGAVRVLKALEELVA